MEQKRLGFFSTRENRAWHEIHGWLLPSAAELLYKYASQANTKGSVVEIGSYSGKSTVCIAYALKDKRQKNNTSQLVAIDIRFQPDFTNNISQFGLSDFINIIESSSLDVAGNWGQPVSFLYIDGHHGKAQAYADFMVWDTLVMEGGVVALDDTAGFMLGPNLQIQAAIRTGAYELLSETGGVSFLMKNKNLLPVIGDFPLSQGSLIAYTDYVSAWLGAMDPAFRLPQKPKLFPKPNHNKGFWRRVGKNLLDISPRQVLHFISKEFASQKQVKPPHVNIENSDENIYVPEILKKPNHILKWLETEHHPDKAVENTLLYLSACLDMHLNHISKAIIKLERLSIFNNTLDFIHYNISIRELSCLRLAQSYDIQGVRDIAKEKYQDLVKKSTVPEIRQQAELGLLKPFRIPNVSNKLLLREYNLDLSRYKTIHNPTNAKHSIQT